MDQNKTAEAPAASGINHRMNHRCQKGAAPTAGLTMASVEAIPARIDWQ
jgi:hypothetical protein